MLRNANNNNESLAGFSSLNNRDSRMSKFIYEDIRSTNDNHVVNNVIKNGSFDENELFFSPLTEEEHRAIINSR
mgnify:CR=1 FL=1